MKKQKQSKRHKPFHLHAEHFFRKQYCVYAVLVLLAVGFVKTEGRLFGVIREAYAQGYGMVGQYMREETTRMPITFAVARIPTTSSK